MYRDDHAAALARVHAAERDAALLRAETERLTAELAVAREWLGGPRKRAILAAAVAAIAVGAGALGLVIGRGPDCPVYAPPPPPPPVPTTFGVLVAHGPEVGHWTMKAARCIPRDIGVELTSLSSDDFSVGIIGNDVEIETPYSTVLLERTHCRALRETVVRKADDAESFNGSLALDCTFRGNIVQGYIEFANCRRDVRP